jgi:hypothetical protein
MKKQTLRDHHRSQRKEEKTAQADLNYFPIAPSKLPVLSKTICKKK